MMLIRSNYSALYAVQVLKYKLTDGSIRNISHDKIIVTSEHAMVETVDGIVKTKLGDWIIIAGDVKKPDLIIVSNEVFKSLYRKF